MSRTDKAWNYYGDRDPYFGVLTDDQFRKEAFDEKAKSAFLTTGEEYIENVLGTIRCHLTADFRPTRALDFGCGVGRLTLPLARSCESVVGVDISPSMLTEARINAHAAGIANVDFVLSDDTLSRVAGTFNLIHSFIVFQHMTPARGEMIAGQMIERLEEGGIGVLHFTYANSAKTPPPIARRVLTATYSRFPIVYGLRNLAKGAPFGLPPMQMNLYNLNNVYRLLQESECHDVHLRFTEASHYGFPIYGAVVYFLKKRQDVTTHH